MRTFEAAAGGLPIRTAPASARPVRGYAPRAAHGARGGAPPAAHGGLRLALVGLVLGHAVALALLWWLLVSPAWQVRALRVEGTTDPRVLASLRAIPLNDCPRIYRCDLAAIAHRIGALPAIQSADLRTAAPQTLVVRVKVRQPALLWETASTVYVVAADGTVLGNASTPVVSFPATLPRVRDLASAPALHTAARMPRSLTPDVVEMAIELLGNTASGLGVGGALTYVAGDGFVAVLPGGTRVYYGTPQLVRSTTPAQAGDGLRAGVRAELALASAMQPSLTRRGAVASVIDVRWGVRSYYRP